MGRLNNRNYNRKHGIYFSNRPREPTPPPPIELPLEGPNAVNIADDPKLEWYTGEDAGGMKMTFGQKYYNKPINEIPFGYLTWCQTEASYVPAHILDAIQKYKDGLKDWLADGNCGKFIVPFGKTYKGMPLEKCRDKDWVRWMIGFIERKPKLKTQHDIFLWVLYKWLNTIRPQNVKRDVGRRIRNEELDYNSEDADSMDDADEDGNLDGFVVPDDEEGEDGDGTSGGEGDEADSDDGSDDYTGEISDSELEDILEGDAQHGLSADNNPPTQESQESSDEDHHPILPPQTPSPSKRARRRLVVTDDEEDEDEDEQTPRAARSVTKRKLVPTSPFDPRRVNKRLRSCQ